MSLLGADCPVDRSTGAEPSLKNHADHSDLNCGVVLSGDGLFVYPRDLYNAATSRTLGNPAIISIFINNCKFVFLFILC